MSKPRRPSDAPNGRDTLTAEFETVLGLRFINAPVDEAIKLLATGGLMVVPSAPVLMMLVTNPECRRALEASDFAIADSAYMSLIWRVAIRRHLHRISGLQFLRAFLRAPVARGRGDLFLVNPSDEEGQRNRLLLRQHGFNITESDCYTAPVYDPANVRDPNLVERLEAARPKYILLNLGGGIQEPLGLYLKRHLSFAPAIICTGAAIAFLTGRQASISPLADRLGIGWFVRCLRDPRRFVPRYARSIGVASLVLRFGSEMPPTRG